MAEGVRIQKVLADAGLASRRAAEALITAGRVTVNGQHARLGQRVDPQRDQLTLDGRPVTGAAEPIYLALAKPAGVTSTVADRHARTTVVQLVPPEIRRRARRIYPVGRLDRESEGLLLLTNDGAWAERMLHPRYGVEREYAVGLVSRLDEGQQRRLHGGVELEEGIARLGRLRAAKAHELRELERLLGADARQLVWYHAVVRQGWRRQIRRMFAAVDAPLARLVRVRIGNLRLEGMSVGDVRELSPAEREELGALADAAAASASVERMPARTAQLVVSLDGPGSSGKSSVGAAAARILGYRFCDTGVLYRGLTWLALAHAVDPDDALALAGLVEQLKLAPDREERYVRLLARGREITAELHTPDVDRLVSVVSRHPEVRAALLPVQRALARGGRIIVAGRDIGTVVLPDADLKLYLHVSIEERARRRAEERGLLGDRDARAAIERDLRRRDGADSSRQTAPLRVPEGATVIETDGNTFEQTVAAAVAVIRRAGEQAGETSGA